jgi:predicted RNA-binding protein Jag
MTFVDQHRQSGQSTDMFLTNLAQTNPDRANYLTKLPDATKDQLFNDIPKTPDQIRSLLTPRNLEAEKTANELVNQTFHEVARTTAVQSFLETVVTSMDYALGASSTLA